MELQPNPLYRGLRPFVLRGRALWVWRLALLLMGVGLAVFETWVPAVAFAAVWLIAELLMHRERRRGTRGQPTDSG